MSNSKQGDLQLIQAARADLDNFKLLYEKYVKAVFRYTYNRSGRKKELAEDITSETFVKAIEKFHTFDYKNKPFVTWLYTIAHNWCACTGTTQEKLECVCLGLWHT